MGTSGSKPEGNDTGKCRLDKDEMRRLQNEFRTFIDKRDMINEREFKAYLETVLSDYVTQRLCHYLAQIHGPNHLKTAPITFSALLTFVTEFLKGNQADQYRIFTKLSADSIPPTAENVFKITSNIIYSYLKAVKNTKSFSCWKDGVNESDCDKLGRFLLHDLIYKDKALKDCFNIPFVSDQSVSVEDIEKWYYQSPLVANMITKVFKILFKFENESDTIMSDGNKELLPMCYGVNWNSTKSLLSFTDIILLNNNIPGHLRDKWRFLFSSHQFGENFSQLLRRVVNRGPNIIVIKEKNGNIFGGYASESWNVQPQFLGTSDCFLFTLHPHIGIFPATGYNDHFMYLNINQQTMPNGLGMGGQLGYFGLWLESEYGKGTCSKTCTTYHSPQLCSCGDFLIDAIEVWGVGPEPMLQEEGTRSALDNIDPELKAILELTNRGTISDAIREADKKASQNKEERNE